MLIRNDKVMGRLDKWLSNSCLHISLAPSQSRWGIVQLLLSTAWFFIALFAAFWAIYLEDKMPIWVVYVPSGLGVIVFIFLAMLSLYLLRNQNQDQTMQDISGIKKYLTEDLPPELKEIKKLQTRLRRNNQCQR